MFTKDPHDSALTKANQEIKRVRANRKTSTLREQTADLTQRMDISIMAEYPEPADGIHRSMSHRPAAERIPTGDFTLFMDSGPVDPAKGDDHYFILTGEMKQVTLYEHVSREDSVTLPREMWQKVYDELTRAGFTPTPKDAK